MAGRDPSEIISASNVLQNYGTLLMTTVGALRSARCSLLPTNDAPHFSLMLPGDFDEDLWRDLRELFRP